MAKTSRKSIRITISPELAEGLREEAARRGCPQAVIARAALQRYLLTAEARRS